MSQLYAKKNSGFGKIKNILEKHIYCYLTKTFRIFCEKAVNF